MSSHIGERLRDERVRLSLSQGDMAARVQVSREMWGRYERGLGLPNADVLIELHRCGGDVLFILTGARATTDRTLTDQERELLINFRATDAEGRAAVARMARIEADRLSSGPAEPQPISGLRVVKPSRKA